MATLLTPTPTTIRAAAALSASGAESVSAVYRCNFPELLVLWLRYTGGSGATDGYPHVRVMVSAAADEPAAPGTLATDLGSWFDLGTTDGTKTAATFGAVGDPDLSEATVRGELVRTGAADASEVAPQVIHFRAGGAKWVHVRCAEKGQTANPGNLFLALSAIGAK